MDTSNEFKAHVYKGSPPNHCCCDTTWRRLPNGDQAIFFLTGGRHEPQQGNFVALTRSTDEGLSWSKPECIIRNDPSGLSFSHIVVHGTSEDQEELFCLSQHAVTLSEVTVHEGKVTVYLQLHHGRFDYWETATITSCDSGKTWSKPKLFSPLPRRSMIRNIYRASWGEWILPYQYYEVTKSWESSVPLDGSHESPWNGALTAPSPDGPWTDNQRIKGARGWAEVNVVELRNGLLVMLARTDRATKAEEGILLRSDSTDRGRSWSPYRNSGIPNPGSKFRLFRLTDGRIALLHNPNSSPGNRNPLSLWISDDDMQSWSYQRIITDFPGKLQYADGEINADEKFLHFAFDYNRHDVLYWRVKLP